MSKLNLDCMVFGSSGYIGKNLVFYLSKLGHNVLIPQNKSGSQIDIRDRSELSNINWDVDVIYFFSGLTGNSQSFLEYKKFLESNELGILNILDSIVSSEYRPRLIFPSTRLIYEGSDRSLKEGDKKDPKTIYGVSKLSCEYYIRAYSEIYDIDYTILRICVPYANFVDDSYSYGTIGNFINQIKNSNEITLYGDGLLKRTFTHMHDLLAGIHLSSISRNAKNQTYNLPGEDYTLIEVAELLSKKYGSKISFVPWPETEKKVETGSTFFDSSKIKQELGFVITKTLSDWVDEVSIQPGANK